MLEGSIDEDDHKGTINIGDLTAHLISQARALEAFCRTNQAWRESSEDYAAIVNHLQSPDATSENPNFDATQLSETTKAAGDAYFTAAASLINSIGLVVEDLRSTSVIIPPAILRGL